MRLELRSTLLHFKQDPISAQVRKSRGLVFGFDPVLEGRARFLITLMTERSEEPITEALLVRC